MKKISLLFLSVALILGASCKKKGTPEANTTPPSIALNGASSITLSVGDTYTELGATAKDVNNNNLSVVIDASAVNTTTSGSYQVKYSATDADGNFAQAARTVNVVISTQNWLGSWTVAHNFSVCTPSASVLGSTATITEFPVGTITIDHAGSGSVQSFSGTINGSNITLIQKSISLNFGICTFDITGSGTISADGETITINYTRTGTGSGNGNGVSNATYTKQ